MVRPLAPNAQTLASDRWRSQAAIDRIARPLAPVVLNFDIQSMKKRTSRLSRTAPVMVAQLTAASWETIFRRTMMMAHGTCGPVEYQRMIMEKAAALQLSTTALMAGKSGAAILRPYLTRARGNAKRLRRKV